MPEHPHVRLGSHELPVYPQAPMRIIKRLGRLRDSFIVDEEGNLDRTAMFSSLGNRVYFLFQTFVPNLKERMPEYEFWGYVDRDAFDADDFDDEAEAAKDAATFPQWLDAFETIIEVNGGKRFLDLLGLVVPREWVKAKIAELFEAGQDQLSGSPSSPSTNDGSARQTSSGLTPQTEGPPAMPPESANGLATLASSGSTPLG